MGMLRKLRSVMATLLIVAGLVTTAVPALAGGSTEHTAWMLAMDEAALKLEAEAPSPTCTDTGYALPINERPEGELRLSLPVECPDISHLAPGDAGLVGRYRVSYGGTGTVNLTFHWELEGVLFTGDHPIAITIVDDRGNDYSPTTLPNWLEPFIPTRGSKPAPSLSQGEALTFTVNYHWPIEAGNIYQTELGHLRMEVVVTPGKGGGGDPGGGNPGGGNPGGGDPGGGNPGGGTPPKPEPPTTGDETPTPVTTGKVVVRILDDSAGDGSPLPLSGVPVELDDLTGTTDDHGQVTFAGLRFGSYTATATATHPTTGAEPKTGSGTVTISPEEPEGQITILLSWPVPDAEPVPPPEELTSSLTMGSLTVRVLDGSERLGGASRPISGATVQLGDRMGRTDGNGELHFLDLPLGSYEIRAEAVDPARPEGGERKSGTARAELTADRRHDVITIVLAWSDPPAAADPTPGSIVGRICAPRDPGARVWATNEAGEVAAIAVAATGRLGQWREYSLEGLTPGKWVLSLQSAGDPTVSQDVIVRPGEAAKAHDFTLACTGEGASRLPSAAYFLLGGWLLVGGLYLRRLGRPSAASRG